MWDEGRGVSNRIYIFAGNQQQAEQYRQEHGLGRAQAIYISGYEVLMGTENPQVVRVGTWFEREDKARIEQVIKTRIRPK